MNIDKLTLNQRRYQVDRRRDVILTYINAESTLSVCWVGTHLQIIGKTWDRINTSYDNIILLGDFNVDPEEAKMSEFLKMHSLKNLVSQKICFKNPENPSCIDLILTNCSQCFQNTGVFETWLSDFHKLTFTFLKQYYPKQKPKAVFYRKYKIFCNDLFRSGLENELSNYDINKKSKDYKPLLFLP